MSTGLKLKSPLYPLYLGLGLFLFTFLSTMLISHFYTKPTKPSSATIDSTRYSLSLSSSHGSKISTTLQPAPNDPAIAIIKDTVTVTNNAPSGYKLYLSTNDNHPNSTHLRKDNTTTNSISPISRTKDAPTALANNTWGWAVAKDNTAGIKGYSFSSSYTTLNPTNLSDYTETEATKLSQPFAAISTKNDPILIRDTTTNPSTTTPTNLYYGIRIDRTLPRAKYSTNLLYTVISDASSESNGELTVSPNEGATGEAELITIKTSLHFTDSAGSTLNLSTADITATIDHQPCADITPSIVDNTLEFTCNVPRITTPGAKTITVSIPKYNKTYTLANGYSYQPKTFSGITTMQEMTPEICAAETTPNKDATMPVRFHPVNDDKVPEAYLRDTRDGSHYIVRKLADGNCWMTQNLALGKADRTYTLTSTDTDLNGITSFTLPQADNDDSPYWSDDQNSNNVIKLRSTGSEPNTKTWLTNIADGNPETVTTTNPHDPARSMGNHYNWAAATAGTGTYSLDTGQEASSSICPKGWRLPMDKRSGEGGDNTKSFYHLMQAYQLPSSQSSSASSYKLRKPPFSFTLSGYRNYNGSFNNAGNKGYWWPSTSYSTSDARDMYVNYSYYDSHYYDRKGFGFSVRCVAR